jgi:hypothetical protein
VVNFAVPATCASILIILGFEANQTGAVYYDDVSVKQSYDFTILAWGKTAISGANGMLAQRYTDATTPFFSFYLDSTNKLRFEAGDGSAAFTKTGLTNINDNAERLLAVTVSRRGSGVLYVNGASDGSGSFSSIGDLTPASSLFIGRSAGGASFWSGLIGELQVVRGYAMSAAQIAAIYNTTGILKAYDSVNFPGAVVVAHYRWKGVSDTDFLKDETGYNHLTGTNVTQVLDQATASYRIAEL